MKQRISAIILLLSFVGVMAHDMIPHHHHDDTTASELHIEPTDGHENHSDCSHETDHEGEVVKEAHHHHCAHELHNCTLSFYDPGRSVSQNVQRLLTIDCIASELSMAQQKDIQDTKKQYFDNRLVIYRNINLSNPQLRAPPASA